MLLITPFAGWRPSYDPGYMRETWNLSLVQMHLHFCNLRFLFIFIHSTCCFIFGCLQSLSYCRCPPVMRLLVLSVCLSFRYLPSLCQQKLFCIARKSGGPLTVSKQPREERRPCYDFSDTSVSDLRQSTVLPIGSKYLNPV